MPIRIVPTEARFAEALERLTDIVYELMSCLRTTLPENICAPNIFVTI